MSPRRPNPHALEVDRFAAEAGVLEGEWPLAGLPRLAASAEPASLAGPLEPVRWRVEGSARARPGGEPVVHLHLALTARLALSCQRCLGPVAVDLAVDRRVRFVATEAQAEALDAESEEDVLSWERRLDVQAWAEDELLLELPLVPRHARCPAALPGAGRVGVGLAAPEGEEPAEDLAAGDGPATTHEDAGRPHPFAALAALRSAPGEAPEAAPPVPRPPRRRGGGHGAAS